MQKLMKEYLDKLNRKHKKRRRMGIAVALLMAVVMSSVAGILTQYGFAMTNQAKCGFEEHVHGEECYQDVLVCGQEEGVKHHHSESCYQLSRTLSCGQEEREGHRHGEGCYQPETRLVCGQEEGEEHQHSEQCYQTENVLVCGQEETEGHQHSDGCFQTENVLVCGQNEEEGHTHTQSCYERQLACGKEEHTHTDWCWIDVNADVEDASKWDAQYANIQWKDSWGEDLVTAAQKQLGYKESEENYWIAEDGSHKGYTRYGQFAGDVYVNWDAAFVNFCLHYAGMEDSGMFLNETDTGRWHERFVHEKDNGYLTVAEGYEPQAGDVVFFERQEEETAKQMGIVSSYNKERNEIKVIEGNSANEVRENEYAANDDHIFAYLKITEMERAYKHVGEMENLESGEPGTEDGESMSEPEMEDGESASEPGTENGEGTFDSETNGEEGSEKSGKDGEETMVELSTDVGDTTITLSGPASSFEEGKEYSIQAELIVASEQKVSAQKAGEQEDGDEAVGTGSGESAAGDGADSDRTAKTDDGISASSDGRVKSGNGESASSDERIEAIEEAVTKIAEEKEKEVGSYQAFDIKLMVDGEEVQPLGSVSVKFSSHEVAKAVEDEATEVNVIHVDEVSGEATDMGATATEEKDVVIETEHFSVYVYVQLDKVVNGEIKLTVQHWGENIEILDGTANAATGVDNAYDPNAGKVKTKKENSEIYSQDVISLPNEYYCRVEDLSKICKAYGQEEDAHYELTKIWVANNPKCLNGSQEEKKTWVNDVTKEAMYESFDVKSSVDGTTSTQNPQIEEVKLTADTVVRFWYEPKTYENVDFADVPVQFYDYDISASKPVGNKLGDTNNKGINSLNNYPENNTKPRLQVGQASSGNSSKDVASAMLGSLKLNAGNGSTAAQGFVKNELSGGFDGMLQFNDNIAAPKNLFTVGEDGLLGTGSRACNGYSLRFRQSGDTYTLASVYKNGSVVPGMEDLTTFKPFEGWAASGKPKPIRYSNFFWPLDGEVGTDPQMGLKTGQYAYQEWELKENRYVDRGTPKNDEGEGKINHNWFFGMVYAINFTVGDYTGPMEYYFRGDDDFWLFVDGKLVVDIGGIHSAIGHSVDLRQWMQEKGMLDDPTATHTMKIFYMERGGTGSCCYMQFTLPKSQPVVPNIPTTTSYGVEKKWADGDNPFRPGSIDIRLVQNWPGGGENKTEMIATLSAENDWKCEWTGLPIQSGKDGQIYKYSYTVEELKLPLGYELKVENVVGTDGITRGVMTNTLNPIRVDVEKKWENEGSEGSKYRPQNVTVALYANGSPYPTLRDADGKPTHINQEGKAVYKTLTLDSNSEWKGKFEELPQYSYELVETTDKDGNAKITYEAKPIEYTVRELDADGNPIEDNQTGKFPSAQYKVQYSTRPNEQAGTGGNSSNENTGGNGANTGTGDGSTNGNTGVTTQNGVYKDTLIVTNTLLTDFRIVKVGSGENSTEQNNPLQGAKFLLMQCDSDGKPLEDTEANTFISNDKGLLMNASMASELRLDQGTYLLKEVEAPVGYVLSTIEWLVTITEDGKATVAVRDGETGEFVSKDADAYEGENGNVLCVYYFKNEVIYALPSTGGSGIYWYMFGGVLLMSAAALITYRNKRKGGAEKLRT